MTRPLDCWKIKQLSNGYILITMMYTGDIYEQTFRGENHSIKNKINKSAEYGNRRDR